MRKITHIVLHCTATPAGREVSLKEIDRWHRAAGFAKIGYHFVIHLDGTIDTGRPLEEAGAHVAGHNANTIGISYVGGVDANDVKKAVDTRTPAQKRAMELLVKDLKSRFPDAQVLGHRDFPNVAKACPCFDARAWWAEASKTPAAPATAPAPVKAPEAKTYTVGKGDSLSAIAKKQGVDLFRLAEINGRVNTVLKIGEVLKLP